MVDSEVSENHDAMMKMGETDFKGRASEDLIREYDLLLNNLTQSSEIPFTGSDAKAMQLLEAELESRDDVVGKDGDYSLRVAA